MWLLLPVVLLSVVVYAQGSDTIELGDLNYNRAQNQLEFSFAFHGSSSHHTSINYSEKADIFYQLHTISWLDPVHVRANGTMALANITALSSLSEYLQITLDPCGNVSAVVVNSTADPTYTPWRIIHPAGFDVFAQADLGTPNAAINHALYKMDQLADSSPKNFFSTTNLTIDQANFTSTSARNAGTFTAYSEEFYVQGAHPPDCLADAQVTPVAHTNAGSGIRPSALLSGLAGVGLLFFMVLM
ncbi:hypothetical protein B0H16DRAFT_1560041 [Mycena metata]|uniref:Uncharacterized protein n=1 Tax=Mycena metata TaxID=1033252 RepID=A0AAD7IJB1_9AGAR|nr:hypothetical protein B0H16DRAFT_1560041 [Mycena metata]